MRNFDLRNMVLMEHWVHCKSTSHPPNQISLCPLVIGYTSFLGTRSSTWNEAQVIWQAWYICWHQTAGLTKLTVYRECLNQHLVVHVS